MRITTCVLLALLGCGNGEGQHWTKRAVKPVSKTANGVAFTIDLPEGMTEKAEHDGVKFDFEVDHGGETYIKTPWVTISASKYEDKTLDEYIKSPIHKDTDNWVRKDTLPDGYIVSYENPSYKNKNDYIVERVIVGDPSLRCSIRLGQWERGDDVKAQIPVAEKLCLSMKRDK